jgi:hypothetical protein
MGHRFGHRFTSRNRPIPVGDFLIRNGDDGAQVVADGGDDAVAVIRRFDGVDDDTADRLATLKRSGDLDTSDLNRLKNALDNGEIDARDLRWRLNFSLTRKDIVVRRT